MAGCRDGLDEEQICCLLLEKVKGREAERELTACGLGAVGHPEPVRPDVLSRVRGRAAEDGPGDATALARCTDQDERRGTPPPPVMIRRGVIDRVSLRCELASKAEETAIGEARLAAAEAGLTECRAALHREQALQQMVQRVKGKQILCELEAMRARAATTHEPSAIFAAIVAPRDVS
mmetsp:Transcript_23561/g.61658  ORF Transcript_23561/g.61658 Transcript_23561/m.61658 type:complete len:178 (-) Transcript_23561:762-1295(-)